LNKEEILKKLAEAVLQGDSKAAGEAAQQALSAGVDPLEAIQQGAAKGLDELGERFQKLEAFLPELVMGGDAMKACMSALMPHMPQSRKEEATAGRIVIGTVGGDIHDIGKNIVATMLTAAGFEVKDLGVDVPEKEFIRSAEEFGANIIALSALLTMTAYRQEEVIKRLRDTGRRERFYVIVGGGPINADFARKIGADGFGATAVDAIKLSKALLSRRIPPPLPEPLIFG
jgi:corrinoid protein of di/trimethylamine methyltransferase